VSDEVKTLLGWLALPPVFVAGVWWVTTTEHGALHIAYATSAFWFALWAPNVYRAARAVVRRDPTPPTRFEAFRDRVLSKPGAREEFEREREAIRVWLRDARLGSEGHPERPLSLEEVRESAKRATEEIERDWPDWKKRL
jgi:hypothetical protein